MKIVKKLLAVALVLLSVSTVAAQSTGYSVVTGYPYLKMKVKRCEVSGRICVIELLITNVGSSDVELNVGGGSSNSKAYDDEGNVYEGGNLKVGYGNNDVYTGYTAIPLPSQVPVKARIQINGVASAASVFSRIDLNAYSHTWNLRNHVIKFTNVPIYREGN